MRTFVASAKSADSRWHVIDAGDQVLGRVATLAARLLDAANSKDTPTWNEKAVDPKGILVGAKLSGSTQQKRSCVSAQSSTSGGIRRGTRCTRPRSMRAPRPPAAASSLVAHATPPAP